MSAKKLVWSVVDRVFLVMYGTQSPTDEEWASHLRAIEQQGIERTMQIIVTEGGGPTRVQRRYLQQLLAGRSVGVAVLSNDAAVRRTVTLMSWFNGNIRAFPLTGVVDALRYLAIPTSRADLIERELMTLRRMLEPGRGSAS